MAERQFLQFGGLSQPIALSGCHHCARDFPALFRGWRISTVSEASGAPVLTLSHTGREYSLSAPWFAEPFHCEDKAEAICAFIAELTRALVNDDPRILYLHGAAAEFAGRLVIFPSRYRAGKSVLCAHLAAAGTRLFADDVLPIGGPKDHGVALGIAPRLRLPLPEDLPAATRSFIDRRRGLSGGRYLYLDLSARELAEHGTSAPIGGFVLLERITGAAPELIPVTRATVLRQVIRQNFARHAPAPEILQRLHRIVDAAACYRLRYARADEAAILLRDTFASWPRATAPCGAAPNVKPAVKQATRSGTLAAGHYRRNPVVSEIMMDGERFLADPERANIHSLNPIGSAIWQALAEPMTIGQLMDLLQSAFPNVAQSRIQKDVRALMAELTAKSLVIRGSKADRRPRRRRTAGR